MALHWDISRVKNNETLCFTGQGELTPRTDSLIWLTMIVGIDRITQDNWREFYTRVRIHERLFGCLVSKVSEKEGDLAQTRTDLPCTPEDVEAHIGLSTNADRLTALQYDKRVMTRLRRSALVRLKMG